MKDLKIERLKNFKKDGNKGKFNLAIYSLIIAVFGSCNLFVNNVGLGASLSIEDAKARKVFVQEYKTIEPTIKINDTIQLHISSA